MSNQQLPDDHLEAALNRPLMERWDRKKGFTVGTVVWEPWPEDSHAIVLTGRYRYDILWDDINSPAKLVQWLEHLKSKTWFTDLMCGELVAVWLKVWGDPKRREYAWPSEIELPK